MLMLWNVHRGTTHILKNYVDQVLNGAINHYNGALATAYNKIDTLEAEVTHLQGELTRLPGGNVASKAKVPEPPNTMLSRTTAALRWVRDCQSTDLLFLTGRSTEFLFLDIWSTELLFLTGPEMVLSILDHRSTEFLFLTWLQLIFFYF